MFKHKPQNAYIAFEKEQYDVETESGTVITNAQASKIRGQIGKVLAVPEDLTKVKVGDRMIYDKSNAFEVKVDGKMVWICTYRDVIIVI